MEEEVNKVIKEYQDDKIMKDLYKHRRDTQELVKNAHERLKLSEEELLEEINTIEPEEVKRLSKAIMDDRLYIELLLRMIQDRDNQLLEVQLQPEAPPRW